MDAPWLGIKRFIKIDSRLYLTAPLKSSVLTKKLYFLGRQNSKVGKRK